MNDYTCFMFVLKTTNHKLRGLTYYRILRFIPIVYCVKLFTRMDLTKTKPMVLIPE